MIGHLPFAAYNAGEGRVMQAIKANESKNLPTDYWSLSLPKETMNYVPKILALSKVIRENEQNITFPKVTIAIKHWPHLMSANKSR